jgi:hypothetical protein
MVNRFVAWRARILACNTRMFRQIVGSGGRKMKSKILWVLAIAMIFAANNAFAGKAMQMWNCGMEDDVTEESVEADAAKWLQAVRQIDGGANIEAHILFPVAVNASGETDFVFIVTMPTFAEWGKFWDAYPVSDAAAAEEAGIFCPDSVVWEAVHIK